RAFSRRDRRGRLANCRVGGDQLKVAVDGVVHDLIELWRPEGRPPVAVDGLAQLDVLYADGVAVPAQALFGMLIVVLRGRRRGRLEVRTDGAGAEQHEDGQGTDLEGEGWSVGSKGSKDHWADSTKVSWPDRACEETQPAESPRPSPASKS
nr:hypothetical protein [Tanacetum cinerariifolium]